MKKLFALLGVLTLAGCVSSPAPYYAPANFQKLDWASQSFDQVKATCRAESLEHHWLGDTYDLETPRYKACMEKNGYRFGAAGQPVAAAPLQPAIRPQTAPTYR